jgi:hypothetical protein
MERAVTPDSRFGDIATTYAREVVDGKILACKWHRLACARHLADLERIGTDGFPYVWNPVLKNKADQDYRPAERVCKFAELMPHIKGDWAAAGQLIKLEPWQVFILASIFGWVHVAPASAASAGGRVRAAQECQEHAGRGDRQLHAGRRRRVRRRGLQRRHQSQDQAMEVFRPALLMARATPRFLPAIRRHSQRLEPVGRREQLASSSP